MDANEQPNENLTIEELQKQLNAPLWSRFEASCYLLGKRLLNFDEFQKNPPTYQTALKTLLTNAVTEEDRAMLKEVQRYTTRYPDIEDLYNALEKLSKPRLSGVYMDYKTKIIESAEPMAWIKLAKENNLDVGPGIDEAWIKHQFRSKKKYFPPKPSGRMREQAKMIGSSVRKKTTARPLHEPEDIENIQHLGRNIFRKDPHSKKQEIALMIRDIYPRAARYNLRVVIKWLNWANIAPAKKGRHKNS